MKKYSILAIVVTGLLVSSCKKDQSSLQPQVQGHEQQNSLLPIRKVRYELYTEQNFSGDNRNIQFKIYMHNQRMDFDSVVTSISVSDIPDFDHRLIIEKAVPRNDQSALGVGFRYSLEDVGISWFQDVFPAGDSLKVVTYSFK